jgi:hypothetical protein
LQYPVQITYIDAEFKRACSDDYAVARFLKRPLSLAPFIDAERTMAHESISADIAKKRRKPLRLCTAIAKYKTLLTPVQLGND